jgi:branched-chain amino acid transport system permease protein
MNQPVSATVPDSVARPDPEEHHAAGPRSRARLIVLRILGVVVLLVLLLVAGQTLDLPRLLTLEQALSLAAFAMASNLLIGYGGLVSFGQAAFFGIGSYTVALGWLHWHLSFWIALVIAPPIGAVAAGVIGLLALRSRRLYFALLTLAFSQLCYVLAEQRYTFTKGANGVVGPMVPGSLVDPRHAYLFVLAVVSVATLVLWKITTSPFGLVLRATRENRERMQALGVNVFAHQLLAFVISGAFCALAGVLFVVYSQSAYPELLDWTQSGYAVYMVVIGGMFTFLGPALGAGVYTFANQYLTQHTSDWQLVLGAILLVIVLFRPDGLVGLLSPRPWRSGARRVHAALTRHALTRHARDTGPTPPAAEATPAEATRPETTQGELP